MTWLERLAQALGISPEEVHQQGYSKHGRAKTRRADYRQWKKRRRKMAQHSRKINRHK